MKIELTQNQINLIKHCLYNEYLQSGTESPLQLRDNITEQAAAIFQKNKIKLSGNMIEIDVDRKNILTGPY